MYLNSYLGYDLSSFSWIPILSFSMIVIMASIGIIPVSYIYVTEIMPEKVRIKHSYHFLFENTLNFHLSYEALE